MLDWLFQACLESAPTTLEPPGFGVSPCTPDGVQRCQPWHLFCGLPHVQGPTIVMVRALLHSPAIVQPGPLSLPRGCGTERALACRRDAPDAPVLKGEA